MATQEAITMTGKQFLELCYDRKWEEISEFLSMKNVSGQDKKYAILQKDAIGNTSVHYACRSGAPWKVMKNMLEFGGKEAIMKKDKYGRTPLHDACLHGAPAKIIKAFADMGKEALVNLQDTNDGSTPLHLLCGNTDKHSGPLEAAQFLVAVGGQALLLTQNGDAETAYDIAVQNGASAEIVKLVEPRKGGCLCF